MSEIKDIIEKLKTNGHEYYDLHLRIAKRVWLIVASIYYLAYLFTVGGFYFGPFSIDTVSMITYHLFLVLVIATFWFLYALSEYAVAIYMPTKKWLTYISIGLGTLFGLIILLIHLGVIGG